MASSQLTEQKELQLVEKVELRLALCDTTEKFAKSLDTFLAPLLLKLSSPHASVRQAVFNSLKHVLSRVSSIKDLKLPVENLIKQAQHPQLTPTQDDKNVRLYSLLLAAKGIDRLTQLEKKNLVPVVMDGISKLPLNSSARLFHILCKLLLSWDAPLKGSPEETQTIEFLKLDDQNDLNFLLEHFTKFFLLVPAKPNTESGVIPRGYTSPGLSTDDVSFFTYDAGISFSKDQMMSFKNGIFKFVCNGFVSDDQLLVNFLSIVCTDPSSLSDSAIQYLKRLQTPYEDQDFIDYLISLYIGDKTKGIPPVKHELQERILSILNNSIVATNDPKKVLLICSIGLNSEHYKLKSLCLLFVRHTARNNHQNLLGAQNENGETVDFQTSIASLIRNNLHSEGWPKLQLGAATPQFSNAILQRRLQYETIGDILKKDYELVEDLSYIEFLFDSLMGDLSEFSASIQESLVSTTVHLSKLPTGSKMKLKELIRKNLSDDFQLENEPEMKEKIMALRFISIKFTNATFEFNDPEARLFNIWGTSRTNRFDIIEESVKGLHPYWFRINQASNVSEFISTPDRLASKITETKFPAFLEISNLILKELTENKDSTTSAMKSSLNSGIRFAKQCLISEAIYDKSTVIVQDEDWSIRVEKSVEVDDTVIGFLSTFIRSTNDETFVDFIKLICAEFILKDLNGSHIASSKYYDIVFGQTLLILIKFSNGNVLRRLEPLILNLYKFLESSNVTKDEELEISANLIGILASSNVDAESVTHIISALDSTDPSPLPLPLHNIFANAYILPRLYITDQIEYVSQSRVLKLCNEISNNIKDHKSKKVLYKLFGEASKFGLLLVAPKEKRECVVKSTMELFEKYLINDETITELWGYLSIYGKEFGLMEKFFEKLFETHISKRVEYIFTVGEALSIIASGWKSTILTKQLDVGEDIQSVIGKLQSTFHDESYVATILDKVLVACNSTKPSMRKASCVWLLSLIQFLKNDPIISERAKDIHLQFMRFLPDNDELIQETASRGLSLIFEMGNTDLKEEMVKGLLKSFTNSSTTMTMNAGSLDEETQLFEPGVMDTGNGSISTYKDILNLASEVGDPSLVYKFMSLAKSSSLWSSRKGIAFGLGAIMSKSSLEKMLLEDKNTATKLIPKLYRYRFDPYSVVARSMNDIWSTLITDSSGVINTYFDEILDELLSGMSNKEWRVREASTSGLLQLIQTQPQEKFADKMLDVWTMGFRTIDDIKESVREVGIKFTTVLSKILAKSIDVSTGVSPEKSKQILDMIIPFFLGTKGINSDAEDVRKFSLTTLIDLVKDSGSAIKPFAPQLVYECTLLFSSIEPQVINYLSLNAKNYNIDASVIDMHRKNGVTSSPLYETIDRLISNSESKYLIDFVDYSMKAVRSSVGLPSRVASSQVIILLIKRFVTELQPYCGKLLKLCLNMLDDKNEAVSLSFTVTFGYLYKIALIDKSVKYGKKLVEKYFDSNNNNSSNTDTKKIVGNAIESVLNYAPSQFETIADVFMPLIFIASNDVEESNAKLFNKIWTDASSSGAGTIKLYLKEILLLLSANIKTNNFNIRKTCAKSISLIADKIDKNISEEQKELLFSITLESLNGRSWDGKEMMIDALGSLVSTFKDDISRNAPLKSSIDKALKVEVSRTNQVYVKKIIFSYARYLSEFKNDIETINSFFNIVEKIIDNIGSTDGDDSLSYKNSSKDDENTKKKIKPNNDGDSDINKKSSKKNIETEEYVIKLIEACALFGKLNENNENFSIKYLNFVLSLMINCFSNEKFIYSWRSQLSASEIGIRLLEGGTRFNNDNGIEMIFNNYWNQVFKNCSTKETIENVKLRLIGFGTKVTEILPNLKPIVSSSLRGLVEIDPNPRLDLELKNNGF